MWVRIFTTEQRRVIAIAGKPMPGLHALAIADETLDAAGGNTFHMWKEPADTVNVLCDRLAPQ
ncbi:hypothetical protein [Candidatus Mycobacterium methanotrophicum]|uniref:Uncharacterized protein n=1 Tax=Candidatus Mycobacterium methanotrophicum TaxID=2943498 RepID=A0ABY4QM73_9MYCO|nr:hypothetical protein [Candidatus Mycobacterium methanotrophicum]UQX11347.1 hypothetical protein M5I08_02110 [Candidatus Mycobacterium methanotrophicum]